MRSINNIGFKHPYEIPIKYEVLGSFEKKFLFNILELISTILDIYS